MARRRTDRSDGLVIPARTPLAPATAQRNVSTASCLLLLAVALPAAPVREAKLIEQEGCVIVTKERRPAPAVVGVALGVGDKLGTGEASRAVLRLTERWLARVDEQTDVLFTQRAFDAIKVELGGAFIYSREEEGALHIETPSATAGLRGTQLVVRVSPEGATFVQVLEGEVDLANDLGRILLRQGEAGAAESGRPPRRTAVIETRNLLQWALYYPAVLELADLRLSDAEQRLLADSLAAYRQGDLLSALAALPANFAPASDDTRLYRAAVLLATGRVDAARAALQAVSSQHSGRRALERLLAAVLFTELPPAPSVATASEALAESYHRQSRRDLEAARAAARRATELAPASGFAWTRLAEMEFSFGRTRAASAALERGLKLTPRNAQAHALDGFLRAADYEIDAARAAFERALELDGALGNAWLGLGLTKIRQGRADEGRADLQAAAAVEPTRSFFYSYHAKALGMSDQRALAEKDLALARQLDPSDPTPWLYSALGHHQHNRYNQAVADLEQSLRLNDRRQVYRSRFLLDQDRAVRRANLATIYQNNGMPGLAVREAARAVDSDFTNASAHLFLANSFDALRDPERISLRYETAWFNELLLAHLLAPVGGGPLSQFVSQQEYSRLLDADRLGGGFVTEWRSDGTLDAQGSLFVTRGRVSAGLDVVYRDDDGSRPNNDHVRRELHAQIKYQATSDDVLYALAKWERRKSGDLLENRDNVSFSPFLRSTEQQDPGLLLLGWNHRWAPGAHTLVLTGRIAARQELSAPGTSRLLLERDPRFLLPDFLRRNASDRLEYTSGSLRNADTPPVATNPDGSLRVSDDFAREIAPFLGRGPVTQVFADRFDVTTAVEFDVISTEVQHVQQSRRHTLVLGARWQDGKFEPQTRLDALNLELVGLFTSPASDQRVSVDFDRRSVYAYDFLNVARGFVLIGGIAWDQVTRPENFRNPPVSDRRVATRHTSGRFGFTAMLPRAITVRGVYGESMGGVSFEDSVRLEPVQLAGFNQAFRTVISESLVGSVETPEYRHAGVSLDGAWPARTWWMASFRVLQENVAREIGVFDVLVADSTVFPKGSIALPAGTENLLGYREDVFETEINRLVGNEISLGVSYRHTRARLRDRLPQIPVGVTAAADRTDKASLHELHLQAHWNSPRGWFARGEVALYSQTLDSSAGGERVSTPAGDEFGQVHLHAGYRFHRNLREISAGLLNLTDRDYRLSPLTYFRELPRERTVSVRCRVNF